MRLPFTDPLDAGQPPGEELLRPTLDERVIQEMVMSDEPASLLGQSRWNKRKTATRGGGG